MTESTRKMLGNKRNFIEEKDSNINQGKVKSETSRNNLEIETPISTNKETISNNIGNFEKQKNDSITNDSTKNNNISDYGESWEIMEFDLIKKICKIVDNFEKIKDDISYLIYNDLRGVKIDQKVKELFDLLTQHKDYKIIEKKAEEVSIELEKRLKENFKKMQTVFQIDNKPSISASQINITQNSTKSSNSRGMEVDNSKIDNNLKNSGTNNTENSNVNNNNSNININKTPNTIEKSTQGTTNNNNTNNNINNKSNPSQFPLQQQQQSKQIQLHQEILVKKVFFKALLFSKINTDTIEIINNGLTDLSLQILLSAVKFNDKIINLNLSSNPIKPNVAYLLGTVLRYNLNITLLDVSRCSLDDRCVYSIANGANLLSENNVKTKFNLERINLKDNLITNNNSDESLEKILLNCPNLKWLNLTNIKLGNTGACKLFNMLLHNIDFFRNFKVLLLIGNGINNDECLEILSNVLKNEKCSIKTLNLSKNPIGKLNTSNSEQKDYFKNLLACFKNKNSGEGNKSVTDLMFLNCELGTNYTDDICEMLCNNNTILKINLYGNSFSSQEAWEKILTIFSNFDGKNKIDFRNNTLKSLDLSKNNCSLDIKDEFLKIIDGLNLEYLDIDQNQMSSDQKDKFKDATNKLSDKIKIIY